MDGDGSCPRRSTKLAIASHRKELGPLKRARRLLGHGSIFHPTGTLKSSYELTHSRPLKRWLRHCGPHLQNPERRAQATELALRLEVSLPPQRAATPAWALGYLEADGCLRLERKPSGNYAVRLRCSSTVRDLVLTMGQVCGGRINGPYQPQNPPGAKPYWDWVLAADGPELERLLRLWGSCPSAGPKGAKLPLVAEFLGRRRGGL